MDLLAEGTQARARAFDDYDNQKSAFPIKYLL